MIGSIIVVYLPNPEITTRIIYGLFSIFGQQDIAPDVETANRPFIT